NERELADLYRELRPYAFAIAYRMLGSVSEAEDVVQDAFVRLSSVDLEHIDSPKAYLATITTRLAIDALTSARARREQYVGPWLPEPLIADTAPQADEVVETADSLAMAFLVVLEQLSPVERAVFLLREVFGYDYAEIARIVDKSEANCRQLVSRARKHIEDGGKPRFEASKQQRFQLADKFMAAAQNGDMDGLVALLAGDVAFYGDGGGIATALPKPMYGREAVARFLVGLFRRGRTLNASLQPAEVNGQPGAVALDADGLVISVLSFDIADGQVQAIRSVVNPNKLTHLGPTSPVGLRAGTPDS
ncbi:MAG TPA: RNA polymerase sigma-70 factor, partial [Jatrophihabitantaceae bacterium]|nr:RNA polymerase sigma-70 factor [Jatrophihabitantaceae bacterium]